MKILLAEDHEPTLTALRALHPALADNLILAARYPTLTDDEKKLLLETQRAVEGIPTGRPGTVEEMAEMAAFLMTDRAGFINGASIDIDGGKHVQISDLTRRRQS